jgi:hypothetical protein
MSRHPPRDHPNGDDRPRAVLVTGGKKIIGYGQNGPPVLVTGGKKIIGYGQNGPPVLVTGGKKIIGYVRPPPRTAAESQRLHHARGWPRPPQPVATDVTRSC